MWERTHDNIGSVSLYSVRALNGSDTEKYYQSYICFFYLDSESYICFYIFFYLNSKSDGHAYIIDTDG
jgi:hypothetical protein